MRATDFVDTLETMFPNRTFVLDAWIAQTIVIILAAGIVACLKFMVDVRDPKAK